MKSFFQIAVCLLALIILTSCSSDTRPKSMSEFQADLTEQGELTVEIFLKNFENAQNLFQTGVLPEAEMHSYLPLSSRNSPEQWNEDTIQAVRDGFYIVSLDPDFFGSSQFFVLPAGQRSMTAEEYLQLAQATDLPSKELIKERNSWIPLQDERSNSNRPLSEREEFWLKYQANEVLRRRGDCSYHPDNPFGIYVGGEGVMKDFMFYPAQEMTEYQLQEAGRLLYKSLPEEERALWLPTAEELSWKSAVDSAIEAVSSFSNRADNQADKLAKDYVQYIGETTGDGSRIGQWLIALYYENGDSFLVKLDSVGALPPTVEELPNGFLDITRTWGANEPLR